MNQRQFGAETGLSTIIAEDNGQVWLSALLGMLTAGNNSKVFQWADLVVDGAVIRNHCWSYEPMTDSDNEATIVLTHSELPLKLTVNIKYAADSGIVIRQDALTNTGDRCLFINRFLSRFTFAPGNYDVYYQSSRWCNESAGIQHPLIAGSIRLANEGGRTTQGGAPFACLSESCGAKGIAMNLLPKSDWVIYLSAPTSTGDMNPYAVISAGISDSDFHYPLQPGETLNNAELILHSFKDGKPYMDAYRLHRYINQNLPNSRPEAPLIYNTWFDQFDHLDVNRLRKQLKAAKRIGAEVFVIDAGWYGSNGKDWWTQVGDWRENTETAFQGKMSEFADEVRKEGLGFGLWIEPERIMQSAYNLLTNKQCATPNSEIYRLDVEAEEGYQYIKEVFKRLITDYGLVWIKIDHNRDFDGDIRRKSFIGYYHKLYQLFDELKLEYPHVYFEGCASGGMRLDLEYLKHSEAVFQSDTTHPIHALRIGQGTILRFPPGKLIKWVTIKPDAEIMPSYHKVGNLRVYAAGGAVWDTYLRISVDFACLVVLSGAFGISGDLDGLNDEALDRLATYASFFKKYRRFINASEMRYLTPPSHRDDSSGWVGYQLTNSDCSLSLVFIYRLTDGSNIRNFALQGLDSHSNYKIVRCFNNQEPCISSGTLLLNEGLSVALETNNDACLYIVEKV